MLVSRNLLEQYIDLSTISDEEIARRLTFAGIEVEEHYRLASGTNLVIGHVLACEKIEGSDHLSHCKVFLGKEKGEREIVCGAPNVRTGLKVIVADIGAVLPEVTIKAATIKGVSSAGMICSLKELGVKDELLSEADINGIHELSDDAPVGETNVLKYLGLDDTLFDIRPLANRSDMLAIYNIVRELGALFNLEYSFKEKSHKSDFKTNIKLKVSALKTSFFALTEVRNIKVEKSPMWLEQVLLKHGFNPINNIVDIGNYVMLLTGRPLHMYDLDRVANEEFIVNDKESLTFKALDDKDYDLLPGDQVIRDANGVLCLGGVIGAYDSMVKDDTKRIAIEIAVFSPQAIRATVKRLNLPSEASSRFSKGVNPHNYEEAHNLVISLLKDLVPNIKVSDAIIVKKEEETPAPIIFDEHYINRLLGTKFTKEEMLETLAALSIKVDDNNHVYLPHYRIDIGGLNDLAEEIIRVRGFEHVTSLLPSGEITLGEYDERQKARYDLRKLLRTSGLYETLNFTLTSKENLTKFAYLNSEKALVLANPMTPLRTYLRLNLLPSLLETLSYNVSRQATDLALFEISEITSEKSVREHLAFVYYGKDKKHGELSKIDYDFYNAKGLVTTILNFLGINESRYEFISNDRFLDGGLHPMQSAILRVQGKVMGVIGKIHPTMQKEYGLNAPTIVGELDLGALLTLKTGKNKVIAPPRFPSVSRDLALVVNLDLPVGDLLKMVKQAGGKLVTKVEVFDVYTKHLESENKKSVAITIVMQDNEKTLVESDIQAVMTNVITSLKDKLNAEVRS